MIMLEKMYKIQNRQSDKKRKDVTLPESSLVKDKS